MKLLFVYPTNPDFFLISKRYQTFSSVLYQRNQVICTLMDDRHFLGKKNAGNSELLEADTIVIHISIVPFATKEIQHWKAYDKTILVDLSSPIYADPDRKKIVIGRIEDHVQSTLLVEKQQLIWSLKLTDGMFTNSEIMQKEWKGILPTRFIPDYVLTNNFVITQREDTDLIKLGIIINSGGFQKLAECGVYPAIETFLNENPKVRVIVHGEHPHKAHMLRIPPVQKLFIPLMEKEQWIGLLSQLNFCLLPFAGEYDDRCGREFILELMSMGVPWIASSSKRLVSLSEYGWVVENEAEIWRKTLEDVSSNLQYYRSESKSASLFALSQGLEENAHRLIEYISAIKKNINSGEIK